VYEGFAIPNSIQRVDVAGRDVTEHLQTLLRKSGYVFSTSAEKEVVRQIKEKVCYLPLEPRKEEKAWQGPGKEVEGRITTYTLPDNQVIKIAQERFRAPEILFDPSIIGLESPGLHHLLLDSIKRSDLDLRTALYGSIVLSGGTTLTKKFGERLLSELQRAAPQEMKIRILAPPERKWTTWVGGSILGGLSSFRNVSAVAVLVAALSLLCQIANAYDCILFDRCG